MAFASRQTPNPPASRLGFVSVDVVETAQSSSLASFMEARPVVVPLQEITNRLATDFLVDHLTPKQTLVHVVPDLTSRGVSLGEVCFRVSAIREACPHIFKDSLCLTGHEIIQVPEKQVFIGVSSRIITASGAISSDCNSSEYSMNLSQPSGNESSRIPGVRPLSGPENTSPGVGMGQFKPDEAPTVKVYPPANQSPAIRPVKPTLPPSRTTVSEPVLSPQGDTDGSEPMVAVNLKSLLQGIPVAKLGFNPDQIPGTVATELPVSLVEPMMASGQVEVSLKDIIGGCLERYRPAFAKADTNERVSLPMQELQNQIPQQGPAGQPQESPFAPAAGAPSPGFPPDNPFQAAPAEGGAPASPFAAETSPAPESPFQNQNPFGQPGQAPAEVQASPFAAAPAADQGQRPTSPFAAADAPANPFAARAEQQAAAPSPFGTAQASVEEAPSFGAAPTDTNATNPFAAAPDAAGSPFAAAPVAGASPFGAAASPVDANGPGMNNPFAAPGDAAASPFGAAPEASPFGEVAPAPEASSPFGAPAPESSPIGETGAAPAEASPFGAAPAAPAEASPFGAAPAAPAEASPFGAAPAAPAEASPFDAAPAEASPFGAAPGAGANAEPFATAPSNGASPFGAAPAQQIQHGQDEVTSPFGAAAFGAVPEEIQASAEPPRALAAEAAHVKSREEPQAEAPPAPFPSAPASEAGSAFPAAAAASLPASQPSAPAQQGRGFDFGFQDDPNQLALRAIFSVDNTLTLEEVLDRTTNLGGIDACVLIEKKTGSTKVGRSGDDSRARSFEGQAKQAYNKVISLADDLQITDAETFTLRTAQGAMSFFNSPNACMAVLHQDAEFPPGVREKLILVTRDLSSMV